MQADLHRDGTGAYGGVGQRESGEGGPPAPPAAGKGSGHRRSTTVSLKTLAREARRAPVDPELAPILEDLDRLRPARRADCEALPRPCPYLSCRHHLYLDVNPSTGSIKLNFPGKEPWELADTCALDVADRGGVTLEEVARVINVTRERVRQLEGRGLLRLRTLAVEPEGDDR